MKKMKKNDLIALPILRGEDFKRKIREYQKNSLTIPKNTEDE
jgi:hypothetical protein